MHTENARVSISTKHSAKKFANNRARTFLIQYKFGKYCRLIYFSSPQYSIQLKNILNKLSWNSNIIVVFRLETHLINFAKHGYITKKLIKINLVSK